MSQADVLRGLADRLLDPAGTMGDLYAAAHELFALCAAITGLDETPGSLDATGTLLATGRALSPAEAAACTRDLLRTATFLRGVDAAIQRRRKRFPRRAVEMLYVGTGPFAPLVLPLMSQYPASQLRATLVDIHPRSVAMVGRLVERFGFEGHVRALACADATTDSVPEDVAPDIVLVEVMQRSLANEPQVALVRQLAPLLDDDGFLIPSRIVVDLALADPAEAAPPRDGGADCVATRVCAGTVFELTRKAADIAIDQDGRLPPRFVTVPSASAPAQRPTLYTTVEVFEGHALRPYDCGITYPEVLWNTADVRAGDRLAFRYRVGPRPGLEWERVDGRAHSDALPSDGAPDIVPGGSSRGPRDDGLARSEE